MTNFKLEVDTKQGETMEHTSVFLAFIRADGSVSPRMEFHATSKAKGASIMQAMKLAAAELTKEAHYRNGVL